MGRTGRRKSGRERRAKRKAREWINRWLVETAGSHWDAKERKDEVKDNALVRKVLDSGGSEDLPASEIARLVIIRSMLSGDRRLALESQKRKREDQA